MFDFIISLVVLAAVVLMAGAFYMLRRGNTKQGVLMGVLAMVMITNVVIWLMPTADGSSLADTAARSSE